MTAFLTIVGRQQHGGTARAFGSWASASIPKGALVALKLERAILRALVSGGPLPGACGQLESWEQLGGEENPVFGRSTASMGSVNREQHAALEEEVAELRLQLEAPVMPGRPGALVGEGGYSTFSEYLAKLPIVVQTIAVKGPSKLDDALAQVKMLRAALAASEARGRLLPAATENEVSPTQDNRPQGATEEQQMADAPKTAAQLKKEAAHKAYIAKVVAEDVAKKKKASEKAQAAQAKNDDPDTHKEWLERAAKDNLEWETAGCLKGPLVPLPGLPGDGMAWEFPLRGANAVNEYKTNTMSVVRAAGGEIISVKGANSGSALEIWVQVLGSLSAFVANVVAIAKADGQCCLRRCVEGLPGCDRANTMSDRTPFPIPEPVRKLAVPIPMKGRKPKAQTAGRQIDSTLSTPDDALDHKPDTLDSTGDLVF